MDSDRYLSIKLRKFHVPVNFDADHRALMLFNVMTLTLRPIIESVTRTLCANSSDEKNLTVADDSALKVSGSEFKRNSRCDTLKNRKILGTPAKLSSQFDTAVLASRLSTKTGNTARTVFVVTLFVTVKKHFIN